MDYRAAAIRRPSSKAIHPSLFAGLAWLMVAVEASFRGVLIYLAYVRSPTYPWERFGRNVGDPRNFVFVEDLMFLIGMGFAAIALVQPRRTRLVGLFALIANFLLLITVGLAFDRLGIFHPRLNY